MGKWKYYSIGTVIIIVFLGILKLIIGSKILDLVDIYIPYYNPSQYYQSFFGLWKISDAGGIGNAPISMLYSAVLSSLGLSAINMQFVIFSIMLFFDYSSLFVLLTYISEGRSKSALLLTFFFVFIEFRWAGLIYATGLNFFLAFSPFLIYFSLRMFKSEISPFKSILFISLSLVGASFGITEAFPYSLFVYSPVLIMGIIQHIIKEHKFSSLKIFIKKQLIFIGGMVVGLVILIYPYYPWILASLGVGSDSASSLKSTYLSTNIYIVNAFSSLGSGVSILGTVFGLSGLFALMFGVVFIFAMSAYVIKRNRSIPTLSALIFMISLVIYVQLAISFPNQLFHFVTGIPFLGELLITLDEPAQLFFIVAIWEYFIVGVAFFDLIRNYGSLAKFLKTNFIKNVKRAVDGNDTNKNKPKPVFQMALTVITVILFLSTVMTVSSIATGNSSYTPYGNYNIPNYIPKYVQSIYETSANNLVNGPQKILLLPDYPRVERWEQTSPLFFTFPPSNVQQMGSFESLIDDIQNHIETGTGKILGQMDIGYIVVINALNQSETGPKIGYDNFNQPYAILGNPVAFYNYFNSSPDFRLISSNENYSMFKNLNNTGLFQTYSGEAVLNNERRMFFENSSDNLHAPPQNDKTLTSVISSVNILDNLMQPMYWTSFGKHISEEFQNSNIFVNFNSFSHGFYVSYLSAGFPVSAGMILNFSSSIKVMNDSSSIYYDGFNYSYSNESIVPGHYWQNGLYTLKGNGTSEVSGSFTVPKNVTYILPFIEFQNTTGSFVISNLSINIIHTGNNSSYPFTFLTSKNGTTISSQNVGNTVQSLFPNSSLIFANYTNYIPDISVLNVSIYKNTTALPGIYIVPYFYLSEKYGYVWGNGNYSVLNPGSYEVGNLFLSAGTYQAKIKISGNGVGTVQINNKSYSYNTLNGVGFTILANISVEKVLNLTIHNILGEVKLYDIALVGPNMSNELDNMLNGVSREIPYYLNTTGNPNYIAMNLSSNRSTIVVLKENFTEGWSVSFYASGRDDIEKPLLVDGYQMMFTIPGNSSNISFVFKSPLFLGAQVYITTALVPVSIFLAVVITLFDIKKKV